MEHAPDAATALRLLDEAEAVVWKIKDCEVPYDTTYPAPTKEWPAVAKTAEEAERLAAARQAYAEELEQRRRDGWKLRTEAIQDALDELDGLIDRGLQRTAFRYLEQPNRPRPQNAVHRRAEPETASFEWLLACPVGCAECCDAALSDLASIRREIGGRAGSVTESEIVPVIDASDAASLPEISSVEVQERYGIKRSTLEGWEERGEVKALPEKRRGRNMYDHASVIERVNEWRAGERERRKRSPR